MRSFTHGLVEFRLYHPNTLTHDRPFVEQIIHWFMIPIYLTSKTMNSNNLIVFKEDQCKNDVTATLGL